MLDEARAEGSRQGLWTVLITLIGFPVNPPLIPYRKLNVKIETG